VLNESSTLTILSWEMLNFIGIRTTIKNLQEMRLMKQ